MHKTRLHQTQLVKNGSSHAPEMDNFMRHSSKTYVPTIGVVNKVNFIIQFMEKETNYTSTLQAQLKTQTFTRSIEGSDQDKANDFFLTT